MRQPLLLCVCVALCAACGCGPPGGGRGVGSSPPRPVETVDVVDLRAAPVALNWDDQPGPDGVEAYVYLYQQAHPLPVTVDGTLEFLLFEGKVSQGSVRTMNPFCVWPFAGQQLNRHLVRGVAGWMYVVRLPWGTNVPKTEMVTLAVRYHLPKGEPRYSSPVPIAMK